MTQRDGMFAAVSRKGQGLESLDVFFIYKPAEAAAGSLSWDSACAFPHGFLSFQYS